MNSEEISFVIHLRRQEKELGFTDWFVFRCEIHVAIQPDCRLTGSTPRTTKCSDHGMRSLLSRASLSNIWYVRVITVSLDNTTLLYVLTYFALWSLLPEIVLYWMHTENTRREVVSSNNENTFELILFNTLLYSERNF